MKGNAHTFKLHKLQYVGDPINQKLAHCKNEQNTAQVFFAALLLWLKLCGAVYVAAVAAAAMASESKQGGETVDTSGGHVGGFDEFAVGTPSSKAGGARVPRSMQLHSEAVVVARETIMLLVDKAAHQLYLNVLDPYIVRTTAAAVCG